MYLECNVKEVFAVDFLGKKLGFHTEICDYFDRNNRIFPYEILNFFLRKL